ncbi:hypothetical protein [Spirosoma koreense]
MENNANLTDGARQADIVSSEHAETMFSADQAETNMVKLVDGKLVSIGDTEADVSDDMPRIRLGSDEERALEGDDKKKYENSDAALRAGTMFDPSVMPDDPIAVGDITGNPDAGSDVNTGLPSEDEGSDKTTPTNSFGGWQFIGSGQPIGEMIPSTPGTPDPTQPVPGIPETPPTPPAPGPEIPDLPGTPKPSVPEIQEPSEPDRSHEINAQFVTFTSAGPGVIPTNGPKPDGDVPYTHYENLDQGAKADPGSEEGMVDNPDTGESGRPYDVNAKDKAANQPGERPEEAKEAQKFPREMADESSIEAQDMISGPDRSDQKSTEGLDRKYNDPEAAREMAS